MKPIDILEILAIAYKQKKFIPLFTGDAGLGKSAICQLFVKIMRTEGFPKHDIPRVPNFGFIDLRGAYLEAPDVIGRTVEVMIDGVMRTTNALPDFWVLERDWEGLILLEEPNRATTGTINAFMQILTDRKVHTYELPQGAMLAGCINEGSSYDVNQLDTAMKNRFVDIEIKYDHKSFIEYIENNEYSENIINYVKHFWKFKSPDELGEGAVYVSPRSWEKLNHAEKAGLSMDVHYIVTTAVLGKDEGNQYYKFCHSEAPITHTDIIKNKKNSLKQLKAQASGKSYKGEMLSITVENIAKNFIQQPLDDVKNHFIGENTLIEVLNVLPATQSRNLLLAISMRFTDVYIKNLLNNHPDLLKSIREEIK